MLRKLYLAPVDLAERLMGRHNSRAPVESSHIYGEVLGFAASGRSTLETIRSVAVLLSVFTHMLPADVDQYVGERACTQKERRTWRNGSATLCG